MIKVIRKALSLLAIMVFSVLPFTSMMALEPGSNPGEVKVSKTSTLTDMEKREALIKFSVKGEKYNINKPTNIVLTIDRSGSMEGQKIEDAKKRAFELVNNVFSKVDPGSEGKLKVGIVTFSDTGKVVQELTSNKDEVLNAIGKKKLFKPYGATNIQNGIENARMMLNEEDPNANNVIVLLTDGEPQGFNYKGELFYGFLGALPAGDEAICVEKEGFIITTCKKWLSSSRAAMDEAVLAKEAGQKIYTVGFDIEEEKWHNYLKAMSSNVLSRDIRKAYEELDEEYDCAGAKELYDTLLENGSIMNNRYSYLASDSEGLKHAFDNIASDLIKTVASMGKIVDKIPEGINIDKTSLPAKAILSEDGRTLTWFVGEVNADEEKTLEVKATIDEDKYGYVKTNDGASFTANASKENPAYNDGKINISIPNPAVEIRGTIMDDDYTTMPVESGSTLNIKSESGILANDKLAHPEAPEGGSVSNKIVIEDKDENISYEEDGSISYKAPAEASGVVNYNYHVETTITYNDGRTRVLNSNTAKISFKVLKKVDYTVNYLLDGTNVPLHTSKTVVKKHYVGDVVTEEAVPIMGYTPVNNTESITLVDGENIINIYYNLNSDAAYYVNHYLENADDDGFTLDDTDILSGYVGMMTEAEAKTYDGFSLRETPVQKIISGDGSEVNIYYVREKHKVTYKIVGDYFKNDSYLVKEYKYGEKLSLINNDMTRDGYTFSGWSKLPSIMGRGDILVIGSYERIENPVTGLSDNTYVYIAVIMMALALYSLTYVIERKYN